MTNTLPKWNEEREAALVAIVNGESPVSADTVKDAAEQLETSTRAIGSKLRRMGHEVVKAGAKAPSFTEAQTEQLKALVSSNPSVYSAQEVADQLGGEITPMQVRGKLLSMDLASSLKPAEKADAVRKYTVEQEAQILEMIQGGAFVEDIAEALGKEVNSIRGKCLSMLRENEGLVMPKSAGKVEVADLYDGVNFADSTVEAIAVAVNKTERAVKGYLTTNGITALNYDGAKKRKNLDAKKVA